MYTKVFQYQLFVLCAYSIFVDASLPGYFSSWRKAWERYLDKTSRANKNSKKRGISREKQTVLGWMKVSLFVPFVWNNYKSNNMAANFKMQQYSSDRSREVTCGQCYAVLLWMNGIVCANTGKLRHDSAGSSITKANQVKLSDLRQNEPTPSPSDKHLTFVFFIIFFVPFL